MFFLSNNKQPIFMLNNLYMSHHRRRPNEENEVNEMILIEPRKGNRRAVMAGKHGTVGWTYLPEDNRL